MCVTYSEKDEINVPMTLSVFRDGVCDLAEQSWALKAQLITNAVLGLNEVTKEREWTMLKMICDFIIWCAVF